MGYGIGGGMGSRAVVRLILEHKLLRLEQKPLALPDRTTFSRWKETLRQEFNPLGYEIRRPRNGVVS